MRSRLVLVTEIISPYRIPLFNALAERGDMDLHVIFLAETDPSLRQWQIHRGEIRFSYQVLPSWRRRIGDYNILMNWGMVGYLETLAPDAVVCGGYNYISSWKALSWARAHRIPFLLWTESNEQDLRSGHAWVELLKGEFLRGCSGFVVPGKSARQYLRSHKVRDECIFTARNAVDNELFAVAADHARQDAEHLRRKLNLPPRFFLFAGRLVREKGVFDLLAAYTKLDDRLREQVGLVFVGDGVCRRALQDQADTVSPGVIRFAGFAQRDELAIYYALADMLILPTYTDPWGLVVNEAMASGLPVILSEVAGCAADLVKQDWNGMLIKPADVLSLAKAMQKLAENPGLCCEMGARSREHISNYSPLEWADGVSAAICKCLRAS